MAVACVLVALVTALAPMARHHVHKPSDATTTRTSDWACIRWHESGDNYRASGDEYMGGAYQISPYVWQVQLGYSGYPAQASPALQDHAALVLWHYALRVWGNPWRPWQTAPLCGL